MRPSAIVITQLLNETRVSALLQVASRDTPRSRSLHTTQGCAGWTRVFGIGSEGKEKPVKVPRKKAIRLPKLDALGYVTATVPPEGADEFSLSEEKTHATKKTSSSLFSAFPSDPPPVKRKSRASSKSKSRDNLPDGLDATAKEEEVEEKEEGGAEETVMPVLEASIRRNLARYPDAILLTQVGSFYESYFTQSPLVASLLHIKLATKSFGRGSSKTREPFCGFPLSQLSKHVSTLVERGHRVVVVEEYKKSATEGEVVKGTGIGRGVTRIVTAGTGVDEGFVREDQSNFVLAVGVSSSTSTSSSDMTDRIMLAFRDISTGSSFEKTSTLENLRDDINLVEPREIVLSEDIKDDAGGLGMQVWNLIKNESQLSGYLISTTSLDPTFSSASSACASSILQHYLSSNLLSTPPPRLIPKKVDPEKIMLLDSTTLKSLEIRASLRGGVQGCLVSGLKRTVTSGGNRLLVERLCAPSTEVLEISRRLSLVSAFLSHTNTRQYLRALLKTFDDTSRLLQRLFMRKGSPAFDLLSIKKVIVGVEEIRSVLSESLELFTTEDQQNVKLLLEEFIDHTNLANRIEEAIDEVALDKRTREMERIAEVMETLGEGRGAKMMLMEEAEGQEDGQEEEKGLWGSKEDWVVRANISPRLTTLHSNLRSLRTEAHNLEATLRNKFSVPSLVLKSIPRKGAVIHVKSTKPTKLDLSTAFSAVGTSGSTRLYGFSTWTKKYDEIEKTIAKIRDVESATTKALVVEVLDNFQSLQKTAETLAELDVCLGFAELAREMDLVKPVLNNGTSLSIVDGRHPTVEQSLRAQGRTYTANSVHMSHPASFIHCLTGPNMAGKSTFLRSTAIIAIMAQAGSFVPATSVELGVIDRIYSRVGARDELDRDRSTFMVEMDECTSILNNATERSLVLLDELGRGTSPLDGLSIAYAALEHLVQVNKSRTLFATHYHLLGKAIGCDNEQTSGQGAWEGVEFWCTELEETEDSVTYLHNVKRGLNSDSAGIVVARLAGMPLRALDVATKFRSSMRDASSY